MFVNNYLTHQFATTTKLSHSFEFVLFLCSFVLLQLIHL